MDINDLAKSLNGKLVGNDDFFSIDGFSGKLTFLKECLLRIMLQLLPSSCIQF